MTIKIVFFLFFVLFEITMQMEEVGTNVVFTFGYPENEVTSATMSDLDAFETKFYSELSKIEGLEFSTSKIFSTTRT